MLEQRTDAAGQGRGGRGQSWTGFVLVFFTAEEEWSPIKQRRLFPLPRILSKLPPEPFPFHPNHPVHPLNTPHGSVRVRLSEIWAFCAFSFSSK